MVFIVCVLFTDFKHYIMINENRLSVMEKTRTIAYYIVCTNHCSTFKIQWKFGYNFNTCDNTIDILERLGILSPFDTIKCERKILVESIEELEQKLDFYF